MNAGDFQPFVVCIAALALDRIFGEPRRHPLVWFGNAVSWMESKFSNRKSIIIGVFATLLVTLPPVLAVYYLEQKLAHLAVLEFAFHLAILYFVIGWQSLREHALAIFEPLQNNDLPKAKKALALIVSRDTENLDERQIVGSTMESVLENGNDSLFASLFWFAALGPWAALLHRLINTLDAMWGYKTERFLYFGKFAAIADDWLGWIPARLAAFAYALSGSFRDGIRCWREQAPTHKSPNGGVVMATGAGALQCRFGGPVAYHGILQEKPYLGSGDFVVTDDIRRCLTLVNKSIVLWLFGYLIILLVFTQFTL